MRTLSGKVVVVTGAGSGIGRATARALGKEGAAVALCDLDELMAKETAELIAGAGGRTSTHQVDVSSEEQMRELVEAVLREHGVVDVVVNVAGIAPANTRATDLPLSDYRKMMEVNYWGVVHGSLFFLPHLVSRPEANLVNVSSNTAMLGYPRSASYAASKFAVRGFSQALAMDLFGTHVHLTVVYPGATKTKIFTRSPVIAAEDRQAMQKVLDASFARPPETVAKAVVRAIKRNRARALAGPDTYAMDLISRLLPGCYNGIVGRAMDGYLDRFFGKVAE